MASVIPAINKLLPSVIIAEKKHNKIIMLLSVNFITVAITMVLYSFFQKTTIASTILDIIVAVCSMTPLAFLVKKVLFGTTKDWIVLTALATFFGKAILESLCIEWIAVFCCKCCISYICTCSPMRIGDASLFLSFDHG